MALDCPAFDHLALAKWRPQQMALMTFGGRDLWHLRHLAAGTFGMWDKWHLGHMALAQQHVRQMAFTKWHLGQVALVQENNIWIICSML